MQKVEFTPQPIAHGPPDEAVSSSSALESPGQGLPLDAELETAPSRYPGNLSKGYPGNLSKAYPFWAFVSPLWEITKYMIIGLVRVRRTREILIVFTVLYHISLMIIYRVPSLQGVVNMLSALSLLRLHSSELLPTFNSCVFFRAGHCGQGASGHAGVPSQGMPCEVLHRRAALEG